MELNENTQEELKDIQVNGAETLTADKEPVIEADDESAHASEEVLDPGSQILKEADEKAQASEEPITLEVKEAPDPHAQMEALQKASEERKKNIDETAKKIEKLRKEALYSKTFPQGLRLPSASDLGAREFVKEAAVQMLLDNKWKFVEHTLDDGSVIVNLEMA